MISNQPSVISELKARGNRQQAKERIWQFSYLGSAAKSFSVGVGGWGLGDGGWGMGFTDFQVVNYLIFREKVPEFSDPT
ncbi:MAG: hypothetical protein EWV48_14565 [Microcystis aeruginosa Ma_QC_C_20070823_S13]|nr:MAG: hypothetical protein EWV48_14565 [Microcystis aeruginosa Ma_QC_C_20070823_S13]